MTPTNSSPTNSSLGRLDAARISKLDLEWRHVGGDKPSKEVFMQRAVLPANHGPVVSGRTLVDAVAAAEELEEAARLAPMLRGQKARELTEAEIEDLLGTFGA